MVKKITLSGDNATFEDDVETTALDLTQLKGTYGKNLLLHSAFFDINGDDLPVLWDLLNTPTLLIATDTLFPGRRGNQITITATGGASEGIQITGGTANWLKVLPSTKFTFSIDSKVTAGDIVTLQIQSYNGAVAGTIHIGAILSSVVPERDSFTFTTDADADNLQIRLAAGNTDDIVIISHPKLEQGSIATPYILNEAEEHDNIVNFYKPFARVYLSADQDDIPNNTATKILVNATSYDLGSNFDAGNNKIVTPVTGIYRIRNRIEYEVNDLVIDEPYITYVYVNGGIVSTGLKFPATVDFHFPVDAFYENKIANNIDIELYSRHKAGAAVIDANGGVDATYINMDLVRLDI